MPPVDEELVLADVMQRVSALLDEAGVLPCGRACVVEQIMRRQVCYEELCRSAS